MGASAPNTSQSNTAKAAISNLFQDFELVFQTSCRYRALGPCPARSVVNGGHLRDPVTNEWRREDGAAKLPRSLVASAWIQGRVVQLPRRCAAFREKCRFLHRDYVLLMVLGAKRKGIEVIARAVPEMQVERLWCRLVIEVANG